MIGGDEWGEEGRGVAGQGDTFSLVTLKGSEVRIGSESLKRGSGA